MSGTSSAPSSTTQTSELPVWAQSSAQDILQKGTAISNENQPVYSGTTVAGLTPAQLAAIANGSTASSNATSASNSANTYANGVLGSGPYSTSSGYTGNVTADSSLDPYTSVNNNAYLASTVADSNKAISDAYANGTAAQTDGQFRNSGAFGGSAAQQATDANQKALGATLSNNTDSMYNAAYAQAQAAATAKAAAANQVAETNQSVGTGANTASNSLNTQSYYSNLASQLSALQGASSAANSASSSATAASNLGTTEQTNDAANLQYQYQQWLAQQPYSQQVTSANQLSSYLKAALGAGAQGTTSSVTSGAQSNQLATLLGLGVTGAGLYASAS